MEKATEHLPWSPRATTAKMRSLRERMRMRIQEVFSQGGPDWPV